LISISRLLCNTSSPGDRLRYGGGEPHASGNNETPRDIPRPVVVWNCTRRCNLNCIHCYASADSQGSAGEMDTASGKAFIRDLADFAVPVILFSGGEPLMRGDLFELAGFAREQGIGVALSSNGTLIDKAAAGRIRDTGFSEVGISLDGLEDTNDRFRGKRGAYQAAITGIRNCVGLGLRVSLRLTITRYNYREIPAVFQLVIDEGIDRVCFYHLAYAGRGGRLYKEDISPSQTRSVVDVICEHTIDLYRRGLAKEVLTVANHADGVYLYLKIRERDARRSADVLDLLRANGGNNSGIKIGAVDDAGNVHPDQFWWHYTLGNVQQQKFGDIWTNTSEPLLQGLRQRKELLKGRCARCRYLELCNGNLRGRAEAIFGDVWAPDPACYLSDEEIGIA
jgi:radical SAM protein with 4Fe4S-binding SPASM domain